MVDLVNHSNGSMHFSEARADHREWIGGRVLTLLNHYWRDDDPVEMTAAIGADWADALEGLGKKYIQRACIEYLRKEPRRKPTPGDIYKLAVATMPKPRVVPSRQKWPKLRVTQERAEKIMRDVGYIPKTFGGKK